MKHFEIRSVEIGCPAGRAFDYVSDPHSLTEWAHAFREVKGDRALMETPSGSVEVGLRVLASPAERTIDWTIEFPDGNVARAFSRVVSTESNRCLYCFILSAPPVPLEKLEGALAQQSQTLERELEKLKGILEKSS